MAKYTVPKISFTEIDNSIRTVSEPGIGIGAIAIKSNKGPVNMRTVSRNYGEFKEIFGDPEALDDYGHFAAENYLANSNQLYAVRATMGDEQYSQIQYAFPNASSKGQNLSKDTAVFKYYDNEGTSDLKLVQQLDNVTVTSNLITEYDDKILGKKTAEWIVDEDATSAVSGYSLKQEALWATISDIKTERTENIIFKVGPNNVAEEGKHIVYPKLVDVSGNTLKLDTSLMIRNDPWDKGDNLQYADIVVSNSKMTDKSNSALSAHEGVKISFTIPSKDTVDGVNHSVQYVAEYSAVSAIQNADDKTKTIGYSDLFKSNMFYIPDNYTALDEAVKSEDEFNTNGYGLLNCQKWELLDWDDVSVRKTYYVDSDFINLESSDEIGPAYGIYFKEYGRQDNTFALAGNHELDGETGTDKLNVYLYQFHHLIHDYLLMQMYCLDDHIP